MGIAREMDEEIERLEEENSNLRSKVRNLQRKLEVREQLLGEAYVVVSQLAMSFGVIDNEHVIHALDNLTDMTPTHFDVLPFPDLSKV